MLIFYTVSGLYCNFNSFYSFVILYSQKDDEAGEVKSSARFFGVQAPHMLNHVELLSCVGKALQALGVHDIESSSSVLSTGDMPVLIDGGSDGHP